MITQFVHLQFPTQNTYQKVFSSKHTKHKLHFKIKWVSFKLRIHIQKFSSQNTQLKVPSSKCLFQNFQLRIYICEIFQLKNIYFKPSSSKRAFNVSNSKKFLAQNTYLKVSISKYKFSPALNTVRTIKLWNRKTTFNTRFNCAVYTVINLIVQCTQL